MFPALIDLIEAVAAYRLFLGEHADKRNTERVRQNFWRAYGQTSSAYREALAFIAGVRSGQRLKASLGRPGGRERTTLAS